MSVTNWKNTASDKQKSKKNITHTHTHTCTCVDAYMFGTNVNSSKMAQENT